MDQRQNIYQLQNQLLINEANLPDLIYDYIKTCQQKINLNTLLDFYEEEAAFRAHVIHDKIINKEAGKLFGLTVAVKDNICHKDHVTSAGSKILEQFVSPYNATVIDRLLKNDAIIIGRANCDEFGMGSSGEKSAFGPTLNPLDPKRVPGGSSSGSAAAVASGMCQVALGSDTGGSVRQPAAFCGLVGLKPTYGRVSRWGLIAYGSSFDQIGIIANNVIDCHAVLRTIEGTDEYDRTLKDPLKPLHDLSPFKNKVKIAVLSELLDYKELNPGIRNSMDTILKELKGIGHEVEKIQFKYMDYLVPVFHILAPAEASSNLQRFDGIRYGHRTENYDDLKDMYEKTRAEGFGKEVKRRIIAGTYVLTEERMDKYYIQAQKVRRLIKEEVDRIFQDYDFIITPTTPDIAFKFGERSKDPVKMFLEDIYLFLANITGIPAITLPVGMVDNMPIGMQIMSKSFSEQALLEFSEQILNLK